ncbi:hypothetical protein HYV86_01515 [Candidatus Woesearchaeota archaeon]|nr:hypothetical protein [Candidatus Woesearchaeota archaeon]
MGEKGLEGLATVAFNEMSASHVFSWLTRLNIEDNLTSALPGITQNGRYRVNGKELRQGTESPFAHGYLVVVDGPNLVDLLTKGGALLGTRRPQFQPTPDYDAFAGFLRTTSEQDGVYGHVDSQSTTARLPKMANSSWSLKQARKKELGYIPPDLVQYARTDPFTSQDVDDLVGTKTDLAVNLPRAYRLSDNPAIALFQRAASLIFPGYVVTDNKIEAVQLRRTISDYDSNGRNLGTGTVLRWTEDGLAERSSLAWMPDADPAHYLVEGMPIVLIHNRYQRGSEGVRLFDTKIVTGIEPVRPVATSSIDQVASPPYTQGRSAQFSHYSSPPPPA